MAKKSKKAQVKKPAKAAKKAPKTKADAPGAAAVQASGPGIGHNSNDKRTENEIREGFLQHRKAWTAYKAKLKVVEKLGKDVKADLKADGYKVIQMQIADDLAGSAKSEAKIQMQVEDRLQVARWIGHPMGAQMDLFSQPDRTPAVDRAFDLGKVDSMSNKPARPQEHGLAPDTAQSRSYMDGFHEDQARIASGFKKSNDPEPSSDAVQQLESGERVSRSEFKQRLQEATASDENGAPVKH